MAVEPEKDSCPKPSCGQPESASRWKAGVRQSICGNGHNWPTGEGRLAQQRRAAAKDQEIMNNPWSYTEREVDEAYQRQAQRARF